MLDELDPRDARMERLEARVAALEADAARAPVSVTDAEPPGAIDPDTFWALEGLHARAPSPGAAMIVGDVELPDGRTARWQEGAATADLLDDDWAPVARRLTALGHPVRLELIRHILRGCDTARELADIDGMGTTGQVYHHLRQLVAGGWLRSRGSRYEVPPEHVVPLLTTVIGGRRR